jgi:hypothetical protein
MSASLIGRLGQALSGIHHSSVDVARRLALLFETRHQGPSIMGLKARWNNLSGRLAVG